MNPPEIEIARSVQELTDLTRALTQDQAHQIQRQRRMTWALTAGGVILTTLVLYALWQTAELRALERKASINSAHIAKLQKVATDEALCPLYEIFLVSYNPKGINAQENRALYEESFRTIEVGAKALNCPRQTRGPR